MINNFKHNHKFHPLKKPQKLKVMLVQHLVIVLKVFEIYRIYLINIYLIINLFDIILIAQDFT